MSDLSTEIIIGADTTGVEAGVTRTKRSLSDLGASAVQAGKQAAAGVSSVGDGGDAAAKKVESATRSIARSLERQIALMQAGEKGSRAFTEELARIRGADTGALKPLLDQLDALKSKQGAAAQALSATAPVLDKVGISAKQAAAALRGVPAQFTDIVTSLQGGQNPFTVLLQQGGQLKDMFGGIGPAARALGGYVAGLINPFTLAAAAAAALGLAYFKGSQEADAFTKSIVLSGNAAGATAAQMAGYARNIAAVSGTQGNAAEALAAMAESGKVGAANLERFSLAAVLFEKTTGQAVDETAKKFAELAKSPAEASAKLNEQYNYLTASVYQQIKALEDQGRATEAANLAQKTFAETIEQRAGSIVQNVGYIERAWGAVKGAILGAVDAAKNIGRNTLDAQIQDAEKRLAQLQSGGVTGFRNKGLIEQTGAELAALKATEAANQANAVASAERAEQEQAGVSFIQAGVKFLTDKKKLEIEIAQARNLGLAAGRSEQEIEQRIADIRLSHNKTGGAAEIKKESSAYAELTASIGAKLEQERLEIAVGANATDSQRIRIKLDQDLASGKLKLTAAHKTEIQTQIAALAVLEKAKLTGQQRAQTEAVAAEQALQAAKENAEYQAQTMRLYADRSVAFDDAARSAQESADTTQLELDLLGATNKERDIALDYRRIELKLAKELRDIDRLELEDYQKDNLRSRAVNNADLERSAASSKASLNEMQDIINSVDRTAQQVWTNIFDGGQNAFKKLGNVIKSSVLDLLYQMTIKKWVIGVTANVVGGAGSVAQAASGGGGSGLSNLASLGSSAYQAITGNSLVGSALSYAGVATGVGAAAGSAGVIAAGNAAYAGALAGGASAASAAASAGAAAGTAATGTGAATAAIGAIPVVGWVALAAVAAYAIFGGKGGGPKTEGGYNSAAMTNVNGRVFGTSAASQSYGGAYDAQTKTIVDAIGTQYASLATALGGKAGAYTGTSFIAADPQGDANTQMILRAQVNGNEVYNTIADKGRTDYVGRSEEELAAAIAEAQAKALINLLKNTQLDGNVNTFIQSLDTASMSVAQINEALTRATGFVAFNKALESLPLANLKNLSLQAAEALSAAAGGFDALKTNASSFYENYYSEAERTSVATSNVASTLARLGLAMPDLAAGSAAARAQFRDLVNAQDNSTESGRAAYITLLSIQEAFASITPAAEQAAQAVSETLADALTRLRNPVRSVDDIASNTVNLEKQVFAAENVGNTAALREREMRGYTEWERALQTYLYAMQDAAAATQRAAVVASERAGLENQLLQLQGNTGELRARQLAGLDASNRALQEQIYALTDLQEAAAKTKTAWQSLSDSLVGEIERIRGELASGSATSLAGAQAQFAIATSQARAGDQSAAASLPELSKTVLDLAKENAGSALELKTLQAQILASLEATNAGIVKKFGLTAPSFAVGTNSVPNDMLAKIHEGERIMPVADNRALMIRLNSPDETKEVLLRVEKLLSDISAETRSTAVTNAKLAKNSDRVTPGGDALSVRVIT